jgi:hypothetical protein
MYASFLLRSEQRRFRRADRRLHGPNRYLRVRVRVRVADLVDATGAVRAAIGHVLATADNTAAEALGRVHFQQSWYCVDLFDGNITIHSPASSISIAISAARLDGSLETGKYLLAHRALTG